jgi:hypothetical protein
VKLLARPCIASSSRAFRCDRPGPIEFSSTVLRVDVEPTWELLLLDLVASCKATRKMLETNRMIAAFEEFANVSLIRSCMVSYLPRFEVRNYLQNGQ